MHEFACLFHHILQPILVDLQVMLLHQLLFGTEKQPQNNRKGPAKTGVCFIQKVFVSWQKLHLRTVETRLEK